MCYNNIGGILRSAAASHGILHPKVKIIMKAIKILCLSGLIFALTSCGGNKQSAADEAASREEAFFAEQPLKSGIYDATYFDIKGKDERKGQFDGRVIVSISPEQSALFVYENGNRTKIKHILMLDSPFEKNDSLYTSASKGLPVTLAADSANYIVNYVVYGDSVTITFDQKARSNYQPLEALKKIQEEASK